MNRPAKGLVTSLTAVLVAALGGSALGATSFQTNVTYDPKIDLKTDSVIVHRHGHSEAVIKQTVSSWASKGYDVWRMFFIGSDAGRLYTEGKYDGKSHLDEVERDSAGKPIECGATRPYMVPTASWNSYIQKFIREGIDAGATTILPEEPLAHSVSGYSEGFKREWESYYATPWKKPNSGVDAFYKASKLNSFLYYRAVEEALQYTKAYGRSKGKDIRFYLPTHSLISHASGQMIFPSGLASKLPGLDGMVGQVWTGPIGWTLGTYEGKQDTRQNGFFESAYILYSYFANLSKGTKLDMQLLADPVEDDPQYKWDEYSAWYQKSLAAKLMFPSVTSYEVMPWPDRIFLPGYTTGGSTPGPADYRTSLLSALRALSDMGAAAGSSRGPSWEGGTEGTGVFVADTMGWQRGGPSGSSMDSFHGLILPLIKRGIPAQVVPIERATDEGYLSEYKVLLLSYDMQKPVTPEYNKALAKWVRAGGTLIFFEGDDAYNKVDEWWTQAGYYSPGDHLLATLGADVDLTSREVARASKLVAAPSAGPQWFTDALSAMPGTSVKTTSFKLGAKGVKSLGARAESEGSAVFELASGKGHLIYVGVPSAAYTRTKKGSEAIRSLVRYALEEHQATTYTESSKWLLKRGDYLIAYSSAGEASVGGPVVDVMDPKLVVQKSGVVGPLQAKIFYSAKAPMAAASPALVFSTWKTELLSQSDATSSYTSAGPAETPAVLRVNTSGRAIASVRVSGAPRPLSLTPGTPEEEDYMVGGYASGLAKGFRFADLDWAFTYRFNAVGMKPGSISVDMCNNFLVEVSSDGDDWTEVLREKDNVRDGSNRMSYAVPLASCLPAKEVYVRFRNTDATQGWGPCIFGITVEANAAASGPGGAVVIPATVTRDEASGTALVSFSQPAGQARVDIEWQKK